jgi:hypothetical protein
LQGLCATDRWHESRSENQKHGRVSSVHLTLHCELALTPPTGTLPRITQWQGRVVMSAATRAVANDLGVRAPSAITLGVSRKKSLVFAITSCGSARRVKIIKLGRPP